MVGVPQLCCHEEIFTGNPSGGESCLQCLTDLLLVSISFGTIEVPKPRFQGCGSRDNRCGRIGNQGAEPEDRHAARSTAEPQPGGPKVRRVDHDGTCA